MFNGVDPKEVAYIIHSIFINLTPDLRTKKNPTKEKVPMYGYCYVASEAFYHMIAKKMGFRPYRARDAFGEMHYWLGTQSPKSILHMMLDLTEQQYIAQGVKFDYTKGRRCAFLTKQPSKRARRLIARARKTMKELIHVQTKRSARTTQEVPK